MSIKNAGVRNWLSLASLIIDLQTIIMLSKMLRQAEVRERRFCCMPADQLYPRFACVRCLAQTLRRAFLRATSSQFGLPQRRRSETTTLIC